MTAVQGPRGKRAFRVGALAVVMLLAVAACGPATAPPDAAGSTVRLGYLPNLTHAQALLGVADGTFARVVGAPVTPRAFSAGPQMVEALLTGALDAGYMGPQPALVGAARSGGELRIVAGAASGGAVLVGRPGIALRSAADLANRRIATPQLGNTQDIALRWYLAQGGLKTAAAGGNVRVVNLANPDILTLFRRGELDGAWVPEPWGARLVHEAGAQLAQDERLLWPDGLFATTVLVVRRQFLAQHPDRTAELVRANAELTRRLRDDPGARALVEATLAGLTGKALPGQVLADAWSRIDFEDSLARLGPSILEMGRRTHSLRFLPGAPPGPESLMAPEFLVRVPQGN